MENLENIRESVFNKLYGIDTRDRAAEKDTGRTTLTYLPWAVTYSEVAKNYDDIEYGFVTHTETRTEKTTRVNEDGSTTETINEYAVEIPYTVTPFGLYVETWVSVHNEKKTMMLPVYDSQFKAMKDVPYTYTTKNGQKTVNAASMADIYNSIMRCFAKNLSMWGVGLNFWTKEDAPESVIKLEKAIAELDEIYKAKKKKGFTDDELLAVCKKILPDVNGNYHLCEDEEVLGDLRKKLLALVLKKPANVKATKEEE